MKIAHAADLHFQNNPVLDDIIKCGKFFISTCIQERPSLIATAGDLFHEGVQLGSPASLAAIEFVRSCGDIAPTIIIRGTSSHDAPNSINVLNDLRAAYPIYATDRLEQVGYSEELNAFHLIKGGAECDLYDIIISCLPSINKAGVMAAHAAGASIADTSRETMDLMRDIFQAWGVINERVHEIDIPTILIGHGTVTGSQLSTGQTMLGKDMEFTVGDLNLAKCDLYLLGHIHKQQALARNIFYSGSITRLNHGETEVKGFYIHDFDLGSRFIETPARAMRTKRPEGLPGIEIVDDIQQGELVRIVYTIAEADVGKVDEQAIIEAALARGAADVKIEKQIVPTVRIRAEGISREARLEGKLLKWADMTGMGITKDMGDKLALLEAEDVETVISKLYARDGRSAA